MPRLSLFLAVVLCLPALATAQTNETIVPAGTLLQCTLDEPRFSSETAQVGEPVVCHVSALGMFGRPVFPRGAYLSGRLEDFRDPGHFYGKGWLKLEFESLTLPGGTFPVAAKVVSVPHYRVDAEGRIRGRGHPRRDAIEWAIPILWPEKILTLPMRGPRPTLKGETRILLRLMEDVSIPTVAAVTSRAAFSIPGPSRMNPSESSDTARGSFPRIRYGGTSRPAAEPERPFTMLPAAIEETNLAELNWPPESRRRAPRPTFLILKGGRGYVTTDYWIEAGHLVYMGSDGTAQVQPLHELDFQSTVQPNWERGVPFVLQPKAMKP